MLKKFDKEKVSHLAKIILPFLGIFFAVVLLFFKFEFNGKNTYFSGEDAFYHVGMARYISEHGIPQKFPFLFFTDLNERFVDHQLLFHLILIPFIKLFGEVNGAKIFNLICVGLIFALTYLVLRKRQIKYAYVYPILMFLLMPSDFYFRMGFIRVQSISLLMMVLAVYLMIEKKYWFLGILSFLFVWLYGGSVFLPILVVCYFLSQILAREKVDWKMLIFGIGGFILGMIVNPYFPKNLSFLYAQIFQTGLGAKSYSGGEWRPYDSWYWVQISFIPLIVFFLGIITQAVRSGKKDVFQILTLIFSIFILFLQWKSKRFVEYWPYWGFLTGVFFLSPLIEAKIVNIKKNLWKIEEIAFAISAMMLLFLGANYYKTQFNKGLDDSKTTWNIPAAKEVHQFLMANSKEGDIVFTDDWDVFPVYFFLNQKNNYIVGLDPEFMNQYDPALYKEFAAVSSGNDSSKLDRIKDDFGAKWVLVADDHMKFKSNLDTKPNLFTKVFDNGHYFLFRVNEKI